MKKAIKKAATVTFTVILLLVCSTTLTSCRGAGGAKSLQKISKIIKPLTPVADDVARGVLTHDNDR